MATDTAGVERSTITGIVLHVEANDEHPAETLTFDKSRSRTIAVGRKSSLGGAESGPERALFRCPVVSRKHAKITFTEYGNVYIIDLHSHHGTHIRRPGELLYATLKPEIPTVLADGDLITFGKSVGRDVYLVRPIVVRVELIFGGDAPPLALLPLPRSLEADAAHDGSQPSSPSQSQDDGHDRDRGSARLSTGRYGVFLPSPESSSSSSDGGDSDIQEISPPTSPHAPPPSLPCFSGLSESVCSVGRLRLLQQILPPIPTPPSPRFSFEDFGAGAHAAAMDEEDMDLSSSRASSPDEVQSAHEEPSIIGAWPGSPFRVSVSPEAEFVTLPPIKLPPMNVQRREVIEISDDDTGSPVVESPRASPPPPLEQIEAEHEMRDAPVIEMLEIVHGQAESIVDVEIPQSRPEDEIVEVLEAGNASITFDLGPLEAQVTDTFTELNSLRAAQDKNEAQFNAHVLSTRERLDALDDEMRTTKTSLNERGDELAAMQTRLQGIGSVMSALQEHSALAERVEELVREVGAAKDLLQETCALQRQTRAQMEEELEAVKNLRAEAAAAVVEAKQVSAAVQAQVEVSNTLKRKRDDADDGNERDSQASSAPIAPSPSKRQRTVRVLAAIARTATMATVGAVAAWGALAYS
ncbi:hypothetical protein C8Q76DRAFT_706546 [Earliella scabrosa]|nr:hypothetical protein C8Q76DRAFT_706546 [Earliella scabrosa]